MSIETIKKTARHDFPVNRRVSGSWRPRTKNDKDIVIHKAADKDNAAKMTYPTFIPAVDIQSIHKG